MSGHVCEGNETNPHLLKWGGTGEFSRVLLLEKLLKMISEEEAKYMVPFTASPENCFVERMDTQFPCWARVVKIIRIDIMLYSIERRLHFARRRLQPMQKCCIYGFLP